MLDDLDESQIRDILKDASFGKFLNYDQTFPESPLHYRFGDSDEYHRRSDVQGK